MLCLEWRLRSNQLTFVPWTSACLLFRSALVDLHGASPPLQWVSTMSVLTEKKRSRPPLSFSDTPRQLASVSRQLRPHLTLSGPRSLDLVRQLLDADKNVARRSSL